MMRDGRRIAPRRAAQRPARPVHRGPRALPQRYRQISRAANYPVRYSKALKGSLEKVRQRVRSSAVK